MITLGYRDGLAWACMWPLGGVGGLFADATWLSAGIVACVTNLRKSDLLPELDDCEDQLSETRMGPGMPSIAAEHRRFTINMQHNNCPALHIQDLTIQCHVVERYLGLAAIRWKRSSLFLTVARILSH